MRVTYFWTKQEDTYLKVFFYKLDKEEIIKQLHIINPKAKRTACSIQNRAYKLNLHLIPKVPEEIERKYYETEDDILQEINLSYDSENLKGWELEQFKKL